MHPVDRHTRATEVTRARFSKRSSLRRHDDGTHHGRVDQAGNPRDTIQSEPYNLEGNLGSARSVVITSGTNSVILVADPVNQRIEKFEKPKEFRIVALIFAGRRDRLSILDCYLQVCGYLPFLCLGSATLTQSNLH